MAGWRNVYWATKIKKAVPGDEADAEKTFTVNVSREGVSILSSRRWVKGEMVEISIETPGSGIFTCTARVSGMESMAVAGRLIAGENVVKLKFLDKYLSVERCIGELTLHPYSYQGKHD